MKNILDILDLEEEDKKEILKIYSGNDEELLVVALLYLKQKKQKEKNIRELA